MPIYEYQCPKCGGKTEELVASFSAPAPKCSKCGSKTEKMLSTFAASVSGPDSSSGFDGGGSCPSGGCGCSSGSCGL
jgi:putative FmdB family regulatory protein